MRRDTRDHVCALLAEALRLLDDEDEAIAAIYVGQAMDAIGCPLSDPWRPGDAAAGPRSP